MSVCFVLQITIFICLQILQEDDKLWPQPDRVGRQVSVNDLKYISLLQFYLRSNDQKISSKQVWLLNFFCCSLFFVGRDSPVYFPLYYKTLLKRHSLHCRHIFLASKSCLFIFIIPWWPSLILSLRKIMESRKINPRGRHQSSREGNGGGEG